MDVPMAPTDQQWHTEEPLKGCLIVLDRFEDLEDKEKRAQESDGSKGQIQSPQNETHIGQVKCH